MLKCHGGYENGHKINDGKEIKWMGENEFKKSRKEWGKSLRKRKEELKKEILAGWQNDKKKKVTKNKEREKRRYKGTKEGKIERKKVGKNEREKEKKRERKREQGKER